jgi:hypothetical protein
MSTDETLTAIAWIRGSMNAHPDRDVSSDVLAPLVGGMTSLLALFTGVGLTADRLAVVFNGGTARIQLIAALLCAAASIGLGLSAAIFKQWWLAGLAVAALVASLTLGVLAATVAFSDGGRPTLTKVSVVSDGDTHATLSFTVTANGVKKDNLLRAFAIWAPDTTTLQPGQAPQQEPPFYVATLRPDDKGVVSQEVSILIDRPPSAQKIRIQVYWDTSASPQPTATSAQPTSTSAPTTIRPPTPVGALCGNQGNARVAAACTEVEVEAAVTPTPTPTAKAS